MNILPPDMLSLINNFQKNYIIKINKNNVSFVELYSHSCHVGKACVQCLRRISSSFDKKKWMSISRYKHDEMIVCIDKSFNDKVKVITDGKGQLYCSSNYFNQKTLPEHMLKTSINNNSIFYEMWKKILLIDIKKKRAFDCGSGKILNRADIVLSIDDPSIFKPVEIVCSNKCYWKVMSKV